MQAMGEERVVHIDLRSPTDISAARHVIRTLADTAEDGRFLIDVLMASSELMSNALEHTNGGATVRASWSGRTLRVDVSDDGADAQLTATMPDVRSHHGRGLAIVDAVASRWGTVRHPDGKTVWFEIDRRD